MSTRTAAQTRADTLPLGISRGRSEFCNFYTCWRVLKVVSCIALKNCAFELPRSFVEPVISRHCPV